MYKKFIDESLQTVDRKINKAKKLLDKSGVKSQEVLENASSQLKSAADNLDKASKALLLEATKNLEQAKKINKKNAQNGCV